MKTFFLSIILLGNFICLTSCGESGNVSSATPTDIKVQSSIKRPKQDMEDPTLSFPGEKLFSEEAVKKLDGLEYLHEFFPPTDAVRLEMTTASTLGKVWDVAFVIDRYFVLDTMQDQVIAFDQNGLFLFIVGENGQGPGAYLNPWRIERVWEDHIGVFDSGSGKINVYDYEGQYVDYYNPVIDGGRIFPKGPFHWQTKERLILADFPAVSTEIPWHVVIDYDQDESFSIAFGFRDRFAYFVQNQHTLRRREFTAFTVVEDAIWSGSPYDSTLEIFDLNGRLLGQLGVFPRSDRITKRSFLTHRQFEDAKPKSVEDQKRIGRLISNSSITRIGPFVLVGLGVNYYDLYDLNGNLLKRGIKNLRLFPFAYHDNEIAIAPIEVFERRGAYVPSLLEKMEAAGYRQQHWEDDNPYLWRTNADHLLRLLSFQP